MNRLTVVTADKGGIPVIRLRGTLDSRNDELLSDAFARFEGQGAERAILDLSEAVHVTAAGWSMILDRHRAWRRAGRLFVVAGMSDGVRLVFNFLELRMSLTSAASVADAEALLHGSARAAAVAAAA